MPPGAIRVNLSSLINESLANAIKDKVEEIIQAKEPHSSGDDDDDLPPAAIEEAPPVTVEYHRIAAQDEANPGVLRWAWKKLWRR